MHARIYSGTVICAEEDALKLMQHGAAHRKQCKTDMNDTSSRSHSVLTIRVVRTDTDPSTGTSKVCFHAKVLCSHLRPHGIVVGLNHFALAGRQACLCLLHSKQKYKHYWFQRCSAMGKKTGTCEISLFNVLCRYDMASCSSWT